MTDLISRRAAINAIDDLPNCYNGYSDTYDKACIIGVLEELPSVEPKRGKWIYPTDIDGFGRCENCKALWDVSLIRNKFFKHCPRCAHPMERGAEILKMANEQVEYLSAERRE
jgi:hypothetical protein